MIGSPIKLNTTDSPAPEYIQVCVSPSWGGLEMTAFEYARKLKDFGHPSTIIGLTNSPLEKKCSTESIPFIGFSKFGYISWKDSIRLRRYLQSNPEKKQILMVHHLRNLWLLYPSTFRLSNLTCVGFAHMFMRNTNKKDLLHRLVYRQISKLITLSDIQKNLLTHCLPVSLEQMITVPNWVNMTRFNPTLRSSTLRASFNVTEETIVFGVIGRIDRQKGQLEFVEAAARLCADHPQLDLKFLLVGHTTQDIDGKMFAEELKTKISQLKLENKVILTGHRDDIPTLMASLDVFVLPSWEEAFGKVVIEAMASGTPVIATDAGSIPEISENGQYCRLVKPKNSDSLYTCMKDFIHHPQAFKTMAANALAKAQSTYAEDVVFSKALSVVHSA